jgi:hypothetical protein
MLSRKKNLLEAFQRSDAAGAPPAPPSPSKAAPNMAGPLFERPASPSAGARGRPTWAVIAFALVLAFVLGFWAGRSTQDEARAENGAAPASAPSIRPPANQPRAFQEAPLRPVEPSGTKAPAGVRRIEESALYDLANVHTVVVVAYSNTSEDLAWATYEHLEEQGLPVFPPVASKNLILVLVGAAPSSAELASIEAKVRALPRDGKKPYESAYRARIDALLPRAKPGPSNSQ